MKLYDELLEITSPALVVYAREIRIRGKKTGFVLAQEPCCFLNLKV